MSDLTFRGIAVSSLDNVFINKMPDHRKAAMRYSEYYVNGRDVAHSMWMKDLPISI